MLKKVRKVMGKLMMLARERPLANARQNSAEPEAVNSGTKKSRIFHGRKIRDVLCFISEYLEQFYKRLSNRGHVAAIQQYAVVEELHFHDVDVYTRTDKVTFIAAVPAF